MNMPNPSPEQPEFSDNFHHAFELVFGVPMDRIEDHPDLIGVGELMAQKLAQRGLNVDPSIILERQQSVESYLYDATANFGDYCVDEGIRDIVLLDKSARPAWAAIDQYLNLAHPDAPRPRYHFVSPSMTEPIQSGNWLKDKFAQYVFTATASTALERSRTTLADNPNDPLVIFDACVHTGESMLGVQKLMKKMGRKDIRLAAFTDTPSESGRRRVIGDLDFVFTDNGDEIGCKPYGADDGLRRYSDTIHVEDQSRPSEYKKRAALRDHHRQLITRYFAEENATN